MRKGILLFLAVVVFLLAAAGAAFLGGIFVSQGTEAPENGVALQEAEAEPSDFEAVNAAVRTFGERLQSVSLQAPADQLRADIIEQYAEYVSPKLLSEWVLDPSLAPGRLTSSP
ncbi:MAG: hypothetical protein Q8P12_01980, partial [bacterium]|nr:hypothetical protein [bacterium]